MLDTGSKGNSTPSKGSPNQVSGLDESRFLSMSHAKERTC